MKKEQEISFWGKALYAAVMENPSHSKEILANLKRALANKKEIIPAVIKKFINIYSREQKAEVSLAREITEAEKKNIEKKVKSIIGEDKELSYIIDKALLAGFRLKTKNVLIKASLKDILLKVKKSTRLNRP